MHLSFGMVGSGTPYGAYLYCGRRRRVTEESSLWFFLAKYRVAPSGQQEEPDTAEGDQR